MKRELGAQLLGLTAGNKKFRRVVESPNAVIL